MCSSRGEGILLNVEGVDSSPRSDGFREKEGIVAVAHREIHGYLALGKMLEYEMLMKVCELYHFQFSFGAFGLTKAV